MMAKQQKIPGMLPKVVQELEDLGDELCEVKAKRAKLKEDQDDLESQICGKMWDKKLDTYRTMRGYLLEVNELTKLKSRKVAPKHKIIVDEISEDGHVIDAQ